MVTITNEQKELLQKATKDSVVFSILADYIEALYAMGFPVLNIQKIIKAETGKNVKYTNLTYFIKTKIKNKTRKKEKVEAVKKDANVANPIFSDLI